MAKRSSSGSRSSRRGSQSLGGLLLLAVIIIAAFFLLGGQTAKDIAKSVGVDIGPLVDAISGPTSTEQVPTTGGADTTGPAVTEQAGGTGGFWQVYFTEPTKETKDMETGGIETHLVDLINSAQSSIDFAVFEFNLQDVADALVAAHKRGVTVRMVYDDEHTIGEDDPQVKQLLDAGIPGTPDKRSAFMHNKFFVIDKSIVWTGSWNVTKNDTFRNNNNVIILRSSKLAENYGNEFSTMFGGTFGPSKPNSNPNPVLEVNGIRIENYFSPEGPTMENLVKVTSTAQKSIHFMAFSFTDYDLAKAMIDRATAGAEVAGIFEQRGSDTDAAECGTLRKAGIDSRIDGNPYTFHHKIVIIDSSIVALGSFNFSTNATKSNDENLLIIYDPRLAALYEGEFQKRMAEAYKPSGTDCNKK
jgi:phosphatidylserine/phosphatidylglycerophosphate/cardiolipin synthase-like enzyme